MTAPGRGSQAPCGGGCGPREGRPPRPAASIDSQTAKTTELGGTRGYGANERVSGRKRHCVVATSGLLIAAVVTTASSDDGAAAPQALGQLDRPRSPRLEMAHADQKYNNRGLDDWLARHKKPFHIEVVKRPEGSKGSVLLPRRWVWERTLGWLSKCRGLWSATTSMRCTTSG